MKWYLEWYSVVCLMNMYGTVVFVLLGYVALSLGDLWLTLWDSVVVSSSSKQCLVLHWKMRPQCCLKTSGTIHPKKKGAELHKPTNLLLWGSGKCMYFVNEKCNSGINSSVKMCMFFTSRGIAVFYIWCHAVWSVVLIFRGTYYFCVYNSRAAHITVEPLKVSM